MPGIDERLRVFISYARRDASGFAEELLNGLEVAGFEAFLDREDIAAGEDWEVRLGGLIRSADTVVFVLTPGSVASERCTWEVAAAERLSKRIIPIVALEVAEMTTPPGLRRLNYIFFTQGHSFTKPLGELAKALRVDVAWIREHTRLADLAHRWEDRERIDVLLLRGPELEAARSWLAAWKAPAPEPTDLHREFIRASEAAEGAIIRRERARQRRLVLGLVSATVVFAGLAASAGVGFVRTRELSGHLSSELERTKQLTRQIKSVVGEITQIAEADPNAPDRLLFLSYGAPLGLTAASIDLIYRYEGFVAKPYMNRGSEVVTGFGYRFGAESEETCREAWHGVMNLSGQREMATLCGPKPDDVPLDEYRVSQRDALRVFGQHVLPRYVAKTREALPGTENLPPDAFGALVSLVYNVGPGNPALVPIRTAIEEGKLREVPDRIRAATESLKSFPSLQRRREDEAELFERGIAQLKSGP